MRAGDHEVGGSQPSGGLLDHSTYFQAIGVATRRDLSETIAVRHSSGVPCLSAARILPPLGSSGEVVDGLAAHAEFQPELSLDGRSLACHRIQTANNCHSCGMPFRSWKAAVDEWDLGPDYVL
jgi:hypothetical protein